MSFSSLLKRSLKKRNRIIYKVSDNRGNTYTDSEFTLREIRERAIQRGTKPRVYLKTPDSDKWTKHNYKDEYEDEKTQN